MPRHFRQAYSDVTTASPLKRLLSLVYDGMILIALWMVIGMIAVSLNDGEAVQGPLFKSVLLVITYFFLSFFWMRSGQTLGMLAWRLRIQTLAGEPLNPTQTLLRFFTGMLSIACFGLGFIWMFINRDRQAWHDLASGSCVVQLPKQKKD
ncbi:RDD family protein [Neptuniibacter sp. CAU 1671]|uniref:RDD family protein n=1 Tax=Neptuniibacter sp. CAU 1671 TaxID=3032593 RepID=UPI0023DC126C|nr:RDD family protein [Neptuniibacter sp. CAU 1671]MDF2181888.1 RDD family protein [Neptuniibacter sp. CAU 1671]